MLSGLENMDVVIGRNHYEGVDSVLGNSASMPESPNCEFFNLITA